MAKSFYSDMSAEEKPSLLETLLRNWLTLLLLAAMVLVSSWAIHQSGWASGTDAIFSTATIGMAVGFVAAHTRWEHSKRLDSRCHNWINLLLSPRGRSPPAGRPHTPGRPGTALEYVHVDSWRPGRFFSVEPACRSPFLLLMQRARS